MIVDATILSGRKQADKPESRLVTAQVLRPLDERSEAKRELFAVKGRKRRTHLTRSMRSSHYYALAGAVERIRSGMTKKARPEPGF